MGHWRPTSKQKIAILSAAVCFYVEFLLAFMLQSLMSHPDVEFSFKNIISNLSVEDVLNIMSTDD